jgi:hypothetical protein
MGGASYAGSGGRGTTELLKILVFTLLCYHIPPHYPHYASASARGYWI